MRLYIMVKKQSRRRWKLVNLADAFNHVVVSLFVQMGLVSLIRFATLIYSFEA